MTLEEYNQKLEQVVRDTESTLGSTMVNIGQQALVLVRQRIQETGTNAEGNKFAPYSQTPMLVGCKSMNKSVCTSFFGKEKNKQHQWVTLNRTNSQGKKVRLAVLEGGYKKLREMHGRQTGFVDFTFYGKLWGSTRIISGQGQHDSGVVTIGPSTEEEMKILEGNVQRKGVILDLSANEVSQLASDFKVSTLNIFRKNGI